MCSGPGHSRGAGGPGKSPISYATAFSSGDVNVEGNHFSSDTRTLLAALNLCNINYRFTKKDIEVLTPLPLDAFGVEPTGSDHFQS